MNQFIRYQRVICLICIVVAIAVAGAIFVVNPAFWSYSTGLLWGAAGGLVSLRLRVLALIRFSKDPDNPPVKVGFQGYLVTIGFLAAAWAANRFSGYDFQIVNVWMVFAGTFLPNLVLMADGILRPQKADGQVEEDAGEA